MSDELVQNEDVGEGEGEIASIEDRREEQVINGEVSWSSDDEEEDEEIQYPPEEEEGGSGGYVLLPTSLSSDEETEETGEVPPVAEPPDVPQHREESSHEPLMEEAQAMAIRQAMSGFSLNITPSWAQNLPEDVWKQELLDGIRRQNKS